MKNELKVIVNQVPGKIEFNFQEIKENLATQMELYKDAQFTEETSTDAKKDIATLRKIKKAIDDKRKEVKNECLKPYTDFEIKANELMSLIDSPIELIDKQVKAFEEKKRAEKKQKIQDAYNELIGEMGEYVPFLKIYDNKWENVSVSMKSIKEEIEQVASSTDMAVSTIKGMNSEAVPKALEQYKQNLSLANAISYINKHEQMKAEILAKEEQKRKDEEERKRIAEENRIKEQERQRAIAEERKRVAEECRIQEEERKRIAEIERIKEEERKKNIEEERLLEEVVFAECIAEPDVIEPIEENFSDEAFTEVASVQDDDSEEPFIEEAFTEEELEVESELPFVTVGEKRSTFTVVGTLEELDHVETILNSVGLFYERKDD